MSIYSSSRYSISNLYRRKDGNIVISNRKKVKFNQKDLTQYIVREGDTVDNLAYRFYGNAQLCWAILDCNRYLTELEMSAGDIIYIPPYEEVVKHCV